MSERRVFTFEELRSTGMLWAINRHLHPRGFALALSYPDGADREAIKRGEIEPIGWMIAGDGTEPWTYVDKGIEDYFDGEWKPGVVPVDENEAFRLFEDLLDDHRSPE